MPRSTEATPPTPPASNALAIRGLTFWYPDAEDLRPSLEDVSLSVPAGQFVLLCGASGSGKSTLLRLILGLVPQFSGGRLTGQVEVLGHDPTRLPPSAVAAAGVGLLFQNPVEGFVANRVGDEVAFGPENLGVPAGEVEARVREGLAAVGLKDFESRRLTELSAGQQQRVAFAAALALRPRILLLDEPTAHLDPRSAADVLALVSQVARSHATTILLSEHRLSLAAPLAERVLVLDNGRLVADGPPRHVFGDPRLHAARLPAPAVARVAVRLQLPPPLPLTPNELAGSISEHRRASLQRRRESDADESSEMDRREKPALLFDNVSFTYPGHRVPALSSVKFTLQPSEVVALVGPSGAGKSTLARLALGLLRPSAGQVALCGRLTHETPFNELARLGGLALQNPLYQLLAERVDAELRLGLRHLPLEEADARVEELLDRFDLLAVRARHPLRLSEGQRRRVALAAVLSPRPRVLVLDEPTLGQDDVRRESLVAVIREAAAQGTAVLAISHDPEFVNDACDRVLVLQEGCVRADLPMHLASTNPSGLLDAGVPLADIPATAHALSARGVPLRARHVGEFVAAFP